MTIYENWRPLSELIDFPVTKPFAGRKTHRRKKIVVKKIRRRNKEIKK